FQAEDGIRDFHVTGVQTCALPISRDEAEAILAEIWSAVLRIDQVGVHDNFFELGGDSILSIQMVARASERGLRLTSKLLFQHQRSEERRVGKECRSRWWRRDEDRE